MPTAQFPIYCAYFRPAYSFKTLGTMDFIVNQCGLRSEMPDNVQLVTPSYQEYVQRYNRRYFITDKGTDRQLERRDFHIRR